MRASTPRVALAMWLSLVWRLGSSSLFVSLFRVQSST